MANLPVLKCKPLNLMKIFKEVRSRYPRWELEKKPKVRKLDGFKSASVYQTLDLDGRESSIFIYAASSKNIESNFVCVSRGLKITNGGLDGEAFKKITDEIQERFYFDVNEDGTIDQESLNIERTTYYCLNTKHAIYAVLSSIYDLFNDKKIQELEADL